MDSFPMKNWKTLQLNQTKQISRFLARPLVFGLARLWSKWLNNTTVHNGEVLKKYLSECRDAVGPVITISNHKSCIDDPFIWTAILSWPELIRGKLRWIPAAKEVCFPNKICDFISKSGQLVPITRGMGVYQSGMDFVLEKLNQSAWIHIFPEGKINMDDSYTRLKWGIGRLLAECKQIPTVIPLWHVGMDDILPNKNPHIPLIGKRATIYVGGPINIKERLLELRRTLSDPMQLRKEITDIIQDELWKLKPVTERLHYQQTLSARENEMSAEQFAHTDDVEITDKAREHYGHSSGLHPEPPRFHSVGIETRKCNKCHMDDSILDSKTLTQDHDQPQSLSHRGNSTKQNAVVNS